MSHLQAVPISPCTPRLVCTDINLVAYILCTAKSISYAGAELLPNGSVEFQLVDSENAARTTKHNYIMYGSVPDVKVYNAIRQELIDEIKRVQRSARGGQRVKTEL